MNDPAQNVFTTQPHVVAYADQLGGRATLVIGGPMCAERRVRVRVLLAVGMPRADIWHDRRQGIVYVSDETFGDDTAALLEARLNGEASDDSAIGCAPLRGAA